MNAVKIAYIVSATITESMFFVAAIFTPIYATPGYYWWSAINIFLMLATSYGFTERVNSWDDFGKVEQPINPINPIINNTK